MNVVKSKFLTTSDIGEASMNENIVKVVMQFVFAGGPLSQKMDYLTNIFAKDLQRENRNRRTNNNIKTQRYSVSLK